jgi:hypothetical protein
MPKKTGTVLFRGEEVDLLRRDLAAPRPSKRADLESVAATVDFG